MWRQLQLLKFNLYNFFSGQWKKFNTKLVATHGKEEKTENEIEKKEFKWKNWNGMTANGKM